MHTVYQPQTINELENWMKANCFNFNSYSINGNHIYEGCGIEIMEGQFVWYYTERGQKSILQKFSTESEVVAYAFDEIRGDKWARSHCIGFTTMAFEHRGLENVLNEMGIAFIQDSIPYYKSGQPMYRTFVFGCDIKKTAHLKETYYRTP